MTESSSTKLVEALRKAVSRTSMLAEGNDPELDSVLRKIRQGIAKGADEASIQSLLTNAEPLLLKIDEARLSRSKQVRDTLHDLIDLLERLEAYRVPQSEKKDLETLIRSNWQSPSHWPELFKAYNKLAENTLSHPIEGNSDEKPSLFKRLFTRPSTEASKSQKNEQELMVHISHTLAGLLDNLSLPSDYDDQTLDLKKALSVNPDFQQLPLLLDEVIGLIMIAMGKNQEGLTNYLSQLNKQLASINKSIVHSYHSQQSLNESREGFDSTLKKHVKDTNDAVQEADNLDELKSLINQRMSSISNTMAEYRQKMIEQEKSATQSISLLRSKVTRMEKDAISLRSRLQEKLTQAMTDALTNLPNRAAYQDTILPLCQAMSQSKQSICLAVCDIDHFKQINDTWGHLAGDKVLRLVPRQIRPALAKEDMAFRYGGEEFVIIFPRTNLEQASKRAETIRQEVEKTPFNVNGEPVSITISIGLAELHPGENHESLFSRADKQLYLAKEAGRNRIMIDN